MAFLQDERLLEVKTPLGADTLVIHHLSAREGISSLFRFQLDLLSESEVEVPLPALLGKTISVSLRDGETKRYFHGIAGRITAGPRDDRFRHYHAVVVPWLWLLTLKSDCRIFQDKTVLEIIKSVFDDLKKSCPEVRYRDATTGNHIPLDYCVQYRETDFNFVSRLMEQEGIFYLFEHSQDKHTLVLGDASGAVAKCPGQSKVLYHEDGIGEREGVITRWLEDREQLSSKYSLRDHHFQLPADPLEVSDQAHDTTVSTLEFYDYPGEFTARFNKPEQRLGLIEKEGDKLIRIRMDETLLPEVLCTGQSTRRNLIAGHRFSLTRHFSGDGDYILTEVHHTVAQSPDYISGMAADAPYQNRFTCVPAAAHMRPRRLTAKPVIRGPQTAVVAVKQGEESWLDKFGRVRVQFFWERQGKNDETSACWVRVAQRWAGAGWGAHFWPRIGQEVVVEFLEGDPDRPLITGSLYNAANRPPYPLPENYTRSGIVTFSSKNGQSKNFNELRIEDKTGHEQIFINAERDMDWRVENDHREFVGNNRDLIVKATQTERMEGNKHEHVKGEHVEKVDGNASREVGGDDKEKITGKLSLVVLGADHQTVGNVYVLEAKSEIHLQSGGKIVIDGMQTSVKGSGGFVDIGMGGVAIQGITVKINSGGSAGTGTAASPDAPAAPNEAKVADDVTARVGQAAALAKGASPTPWNAAQQRNIDQALKDQKSLLEKKKTALTRWNHADQAEFKKWFGTTSQDARRRIHSRIDKELDLNSRMKIDNFKPASPPDPGTFAYVHPNDAGHTIYLDQEFWNAPATGTNSKAGTLCHEMSHFDSVDGTDDLAYGPADSKLLAKHSSNSALNNADNFEFYVEDAH